MRVMSFIFYMCHTKDSKTEPALECEITQQARKSKQITRRHLW